ncbi:MAG: winged helix-turn-helix domain-containing protein [Candidatus Parvarchaeota archaeon]|nr:winged helix-turn-helix domain-containing protein [Candidatus Parvarchaeota archaeon]MCL5101152.1 winged helix-turn-helix domain-containing protein [Candidatus Parvarchaeota archaeon]
MKTFILKTDNGEYSVNDTKIIENPDHLRAASNKLAIELLRILTKKPASLAELSKMLKIPQKKVLALITELEKMGMVAVQGNTPKRGDIYKPAASSFAFELTDAKIKLAIKEQGINDEGTSKFYRKFIKDGKFDGYIVVGSPDPHGEYKSIARDTHYALYLTMFFGQFCELPKNFPIVLDTDVIARNLFKQNLIVIGGPVTNLITRDINHSMPIKFEKEEGWGLKNKEGVHTRDYEGAVEKIRNPFDKTKDVILLGGVRNIGTLSSILAATRFSKLTFRTYNDEPLWSVLVRGYDIDGDGEIDSIETVK